MWHQYGLTFVMVTHDSAIARRAPRLATIEAGRLTRSPNGGAHPAPQYAQQGAQPYGQPNAAPYGQHYGGQGYGLRS
ncbi:hypothetical protein GCM10022206_56570 [Streptomyces chiangmaiensis]